MLPPGIGFNAISARAFEASREGDAAARVLGLGRDRRHEPTATGRTTPNTNLLYGLSESLDMLLGEGLDKVFARHERWAAGVRAAVAAWDCRPSAPTRPATRRC
jgi:alanine-glyoxylate transaminase/serine-glyoxylate transaminase/serine-pyruvate transaminase